jgi:hypothetical protein
MRMKMLFPCLAALATLSVFVAGCSNSAERDEKKAETNQTTAGTKNDGWWCVEHGVPEGDCALCDQKVAEKFKAKGDWCKEHDRPESQCFICHPEKVAEFAAQYEAKYGEKPPKPEAEALEAK